MSLLALIGKGALVTIGAGAIITPIAMKLSSDSYHREPIVIEGFPQDLKEGYKDNCQLLDKEVGGNKYLLVCSFKDSNGGEERLGATSTEFRFLSGSKKPVNVDSFSGQEPVEKEKVKVTFRTSSLGGTQDTSGEESILVPSSSPWIDILLEGAGLHKCKLKNNSDSKIPWVVECEGRGGEKKDIYLTPLSLK